MIRAFLFGSVVGALFFGFLTLAFWGGYWTRLKVEEDTRERVEKETKQFLDDLEGLDDVPGAEPEFEVRAVR
jgi:hypothetical protein